MISSRTMTHFKKQIIQQHERSTPEVVSPSNSPTTSTRTAAEGFLLPTLSAEELKSPANSDSSNNSEESIKEMGEEKATRKKRGWKKKNCRGQFRHEDIQFIKLGGENTNRGLTKHKELALSRIFKHLKAPPLNRDVQDVQEVQKVQNDNCNKNEDQPLNLTQNVVADENSDNNPTIDADKQTQNGFVSVIKKATKSDVDSTKSADEIVPIVPNTTDKVPSSFVVVMNNDSSTVNVEQNGSVIKVAPTLKGTEVNDANANVNVNVNKEPIVSTKNLHSKCYEMKPKQHQSMVNHTELNFSTITIKNLPLESPINQAAAVNNNVVAVPQKQQRQLDLLRQFRPPMNRAQKSDVGKPKRNLRPALQPPLPPILPQPPILFQPPLPPPPPPISLPQKRPPFDVHGMNNNFGFVANTIVNFLPNQNQVIANSFGTPTKGNKRMRTNSGTDQNKQSMVHHQNGAINLQHPMQNFLHPQYQMQPNPLMQNLIQPPYRMRQNPPVQHQTNFGTANLPCRNQIEKPTNVAQQPTIPKNQIALTSPLNNVEVNNNNVNENNNGLSRVASHNVTKNSKFPFIMNSPIMDYHDGFSKCIREVLSDTASAETYRLLLNKYKTLEKDSELINEYAAKNRKQKETKKFKDLYRFLNESFSGNLAEELINKIETARHKTIGATQDVSRDDFIDLTYDSDNDRNDPVNFFKNLPHNYSTMLEDVPNLQLTTGLLPDDEEKSEEVQSGLINSTVPHDQEVLDPKGYSDEIVLLENDPNVPEPVKEFYKYVSKVQIRMSREPISFRVFHDLFIHDRLPRFELNFFRYCHNKNLQIQLDVFEEYKCRQLQLVT